MKKRTIYKSVIAVVAVSIVTGSIYQCYCALSFTENLNYGHMERSVYRNDQFGLSVKLPESWFVQSKQETERKSGIGRDRATGHNPLLSRLSKIMTNSAYVLMASRPVKDTIRYSPSFSIMVTKAPLLSGIKTEDDFLFRLKKGLSVSGPVRFTFDTIHTTIIGGKTFRTQHMRKYDHGLWIDREIHDRITDGFHFTMFDSYAGDEQSSDIDSIKSSISFSKN